VSAPRAEDVALPAADGYPLAATRVHAAPGARHLVLVAPATGVKRRLYRPFADHLAARGLDVLTWDWRGTGDSRPASLRGFAASMTAWATQDLAGAIAWGRAAAPDARLVVVGHSFGGQAVGLAPNAGALSGIVTVAAQNGYWGHWPAGTRWRYAALWYVGMPALTRVFGYFPARRLGLGEDLPRGVALQWARWCRTPDYLGDWDGHRRLRQPLLAFGFTDDPYAPPRAVDALYRQYGGAERTLREVAPRDVGLDRLGHFGFFHAGRAPALWDETAAWIADR
jgi:predicted alpha/beta hydrolase